MILVLGEILFDIFPAYKRIGGAPFNNAFHLKNLGFPVRFVSRVGNDIHGREILAFLDQNDFNTNDIQRDQDHDTGTVKIAMDTDGTHSFSIIPDTAYDHITFDNKLAELSSRPWDLIYFGTLIQRSQNNTRLIQKILDQKSEKTKIFCDINLRPDCYTRDTLGTSLTAADILKLNQEELEEISKSREKNDSLEEQARQLMKTHSLELVILTLGKMGSLWVTEKKCHKSPSAAPLSIVDTVGAGDAYAAMAAAGKLVGLPDKTVISLAQEFAGRICGIKGTLPENMDIYQEFKGRLTY
jgi:fructokinase